MRFYVTEIAIISRTEEPFVLHFMTVFMNHVLLCAFIATAAVDGFALSQLYRFHGAAAAGLSRFTFKALHTQFMAYFL